MKHIFYSEVLDKYFEDAKECKKAELAYEAEQRKKEQAASQVATQTSNEKKEFAKAVESADAKLNAAYEDLEIAKEKVKKILEDSNEEAKKILTPAQDAVREAQKAKFEAIAKFNHKYGPYTTVYTSDTALREQARISSWVNDLFDTFFHI